MIGIDVTGKNFIVKIDRSNIGRLLTRTVYTTTISLNDEIIV